MAFGHAAIGGRSALSSTYWESASAFGRGGRAWTPEHGFAPTVSAMRPVPIVALVAGVVGALLLLAALMILLVPNSVHGGPQDNFYSCGIAAHPTVYPPEEPGPKRRRRGRPRPAEGEPAARGNSWVTSAGCLAVPPPYLSQARTFLGCRRLWRAGSANRLEPRTRVNRVGVFNPSSQRTRRRRRLPCYRPDRRSR